MRQPEIASLLREFFDAENARDWGRYATFVHPDVEWHVMDIPGGRIVRGRADYLAAMKAAYADSDSTFVVEVLIADESNQRVATILRSSSGLRSADHFEFDGGLIRREWEFFEGTEPNAH